MRPPIFPPFRLPTFLTILLALAPALATETRGKVYLVVVNNISLHDVQSPELRTFRQLMDEGCVGVMNTRSDDSRARESAFVTIGAGRRARGGGQTHETYNANDLLIDAGLGFAPADPGGQHRRRLSRANEIYQRRLGQRAAPGSVLFLSIGDLASQNAASGYKPVPGLLGKTLRENGLKVAIVGNADSPLHRRRAAMAIAMDEFGVVPMGDVGDRFLRPRREAPFGISTNYGELREAVHEFAQRSDFMVIETGDTARADEYAAASDLDMAGEQKRRALGGVDGFLATLLPSLDRARDTLLVVSPNASTTVVKQTGNSLTPILAWGKEFVPGVAHSATTRSRGMVANVDLAVTICNRLQTPAANFIGAPIQSYGRLGNEFVVALNDAVARSEKLRRPALDSAVYFQTTFFICVLSLLLLGWFRRVQRLAWACAFLSLLLPVIALVLGACWSHLATAVLSMTFVFVPLIVLGVSRKLPLSAIGIPFLPMMTIALVFIACVMSAVAVSPVALSYVGFSLVEGARFYGIGNELGGILIACVLLVAATERKPSGNFHAPSLLFAFGVFLIGYPRLGANFGDMFAAVAGFATFMLVASNVKITPRIVVVAAVVIAAFLALVAVSDSWLSGGEASHVGRLAAAVLTEGPGALLETAGRKLTLNWRLIKGTKWTSLAVSATLILLYFWRRLPWYAYIPSERAGFAPPCPFPDAAMWGLTAALIVELAVNDSGIVGAAMMASYAAASMIVLVSSSSSEIWDLRIGI